MEYASTVIDFGYYTRDKIASDEFPPNIDTESTSQKQYIRDRMDNILVLLHSKGAEYSERYLNKSIDRNMKVVREEKGYIAGAKYYMDELKEVKFISGVKKSFENSYLWQQRRELREQRRTGAQSDEPRKESRFIKFLSEETRNKLRSQALEEEGFANGENKWSSQN